MKRLFSVVLVAITTLQFVYAQTTAGQDPKAKKVLDDMSKTYKEMSGFKAKFSYELENKDYNMKEQAEGEIAVKGSKYFLKMQDQQIYNNGTTVWTYIKETNEVMINNYTPEPDDITPDKIYTMYKKGYKYILIGEQNVDGNIVQIVDLEPIDRNAKINKIRLIINKKDNYLKSWKIFENTGSVYTYSIKNFTPNVALEDSYFNFDKSKYPGVQVEDLRKF